MYCAAQRILQAGSRASSRIKSAPHILLKRVFYYAHQAATVGSMTESNKRAFMTNINPNTFTTRPEIEGTFGVVTSTHWIATAVGMATLGKGGNAFDAGGGATSRWA